ncbi:protein kinase domain-containing protein [Diplodia corticola]|uniref:mitogen-activated protein kinase kinase n=1 Tax=Diplodia corticola TaxID=236234 RepID=A0A1J9S489_9PEZI|nr:protein kinase domain-containing protein [Diplodia corticola]OJD34796.1 protein kinase domain-containing protein [Diplodia corticola]
MYHHGPSRLQLLPPTDPVRDSPSASPLREQPAALLPTAVTRDRRAQDPSNLLLSTYGSSPPPKMALSSGHGDSTVTPPATPTSPRFTTLPIRSDHTASCARGHKHSLPALSPTINTSMTIANTILPAASTPAMAPPSSYLYTSPDGVWENSTPYTIMHEAPIGTGLWSSVYLATPNTAGRQSPTSNAQQYMASKETPAAAPPWTPPPTPIRRRGQSNSVSSTDSYMTQFSSSTAATEPTTTGNNRPSSSSSPPPPPSTNTTTTTPTTTAAPPPPAIWAIKAPAARAAFSVIRSEARMLTHIVAASANRNSRSSSSGGGSSDIKDRSETRPAAPTDFMVPFLGLDPRSGSLLMQALPLTLDDLIRGDLQDLASLRPSSSFSSSGSISGGRGVVVVNDAKGEAARARLVAELLPRLATRLLAGLQWLHEEAGVVHADVKPSNILLRPRGEGTAEAMIRRRLVPFQAERAGAGAGADAAASLGRPSMLVRCRRRRDSSWNEGNGGVGKENGDEVDDDDDDDEVVSIMDFEPLYTDFSAAIPIRPFPSSPFDSAPPSSSSSSPPLSPSPSSSTATPSATAPATAPPAHLAGGTWDFLAPELCSRPALLSSPSPASDVYALGVSLVCVVLGESPFEALAAGNPFRKREMVKCGDAVGFAREVPRGRFGRVKGAVGGMWVTSRRRDGGDDRGGDGGGDGGGEAWDWERWLRRGLVKSVEKRAGAGEWRGEVEGLVRVG